MTDEITPEAMALAQRIEAEAMARHEYPRDALRAVCLELARIKAVQVGYALADEAEKGGE